MPTTLDFIPTLHLADAIVKSSVLYSKFIDGTPLESDIACWMATFAQEMCGNIAAERDALADEVTRLKGTLEHTTMQAQQDFIARGAKRDAEVNKLIEAAHWVASVRDNLLVQKAELTRTVGDMSAKLAEAHHAIGTLREALGNLVDAVNNEWPGGMADIPGNAGASLIRAVDVMANPCARGTRVAAAATLLDGVIYTGVHHHQIIRQIATVTGIRPVIGVQGFMDDRGNFLTRVEACKLALKSGQLTKPRYPERKEPELFSEDLWCLFGFNDAPSDGDTKLIEAVRMVATAKERDDVDGEYDELWELLLTGEEAARLNSAIAAVVWGKTLQP